MAAHHPRTPRQSRSIATKQQLFHAALELFGEEGYHHTTTKRIAAKAGMAVGSFYAYYRDKHVVFLEVIRHYYRQILQQAFGNFPVPGRPTDSAPDAVDSPREFLGLLLKRLYDAHDISPQLHREITGMRYSDPEVDSIISAEEEKTIVLLRRMLETMRSQLAVKDLEAAAHIIHRSAEEVIHSIKIFGSPIAPERLLSELQHMLCRYLLGEC